ncbi:acyl-CoA oxidase [Trametes versicolor FP-101664 SS1]|uniref:acyl-CoA oxidase n=1 Tax=Trametes versicolor (strain FP-101664) TaxID=717944 RepID=UPI00046215BC|nr:acyl-CoA oxidase [Trametes versicolor FP-101664 SS1]EIW56394.1 acyl-CoA oxidase [Trametes versicolor FP-101664 SS1]
MASNQNVVDMAEARRRGSLDPAKLHAFLWGGNKEWQTKRNIATFLSKDPVFDKARRSFIARTEMYQRGLAMTKRLYELADQHGWSDEEAKLAVRVIDEPLPIMLHNAAFEPVVRSQGSSELNKHYDELKARHGIIGCYLQTELGHGTNVAALETTATYIPETREFELHSPTLTSSKWWVGALGKTATHGVVQARLILPSGKDVGPHLFFVQLRSTEDHRLLPGITAGDIGPKALSGYGAVDNGYARFEHVRVPREYMLSAFASVTPDGKYMQPPHAKLSYGGMMYIRSSMVVSAGWTIAKGATIAIRYATVRRQGNKGPDGLERQVITYPSVYYRLLPTLAHAYVFILLGRNLVSAAFSDMSARLASGDTSLLAEMHATTSGLKVLVSTVAIQDLEAARRSMGGHGFSDFAGVGRLYADYLPGATFEGDNFVLDQQVVRAALKAHDALVARNTKSTSDLTPSSAYLRLLVRDEPTADTSSSTAWEDPRTAILLLEKRAAAMVQERAKHRDDPDASSDHRVARAVVDAFVAVQVGETIRDSESVVGGREAQVLKKLYLLYLLTNVESGLADVLSFNLLSGSGSVDPSRALRVAIKQTCLDILPEAVGLTDGFGFNDWELDSALGQYDGNAYEEMWKRVQSEPLNKTEVPDGYEEYIKPLLLRGPGLAGRSKL